MRYTPSILIFLGIALIVSCIICIPSAGQVDSVRAGIARQKLIEDFEKRMTREELIRLFQIPPTEKYPSEYIRIKLNESMPTSAAAWDWLGESLLLGVGLLSLGILEFRARRSKSV